MVCNFEIKIWIWNKSQIKCSKPKQSMIYNRINYYRLN